MSRKILVAVIAAVVLFPSLVFGQAVTLKLAHLNPQTPFEVASAAMAEVFKSEVEANSNGRIKVELYPNGVLGKEPETMIQVKTGVVQSYISSSGGMAPFYPLIDVTNMPFAFSSYNVGYKVYDGAFGQALAKDIEAKAGFKVLGFGESGGFFAITNSKKPLRVPADMKGIKLRTMALPLHQEIVKALGASPTTVAWAEVYTSLQTGVVDGQMNPISIIAMAKFQEVQKYITLTNHLYAPYVWVINPKFYNDLPADLQARRDRRLPHRHHGRPRPVPHHRRQRQGPADPGRQDGSLCPHHRRDEAVPRRHHARGPRLHVGQVQEGR